jgi:RNA polymerase sigma-70 factor (ECF subfamily)
VREQIEQFLLFRIRSSKDERAFTELYKTHRESVYRYVRAKLPSDQDAEDATSIAFMRLWNYLTTASVVSGVRPILFTICRNVVADYYRRRGPETISLDQQAAAGQEREGRETAEKILAEVDLKLIRAKLDALSDEHRDVIILRCLQGLSTRETAKQLNKTENATYMLLHRALKELRKMLE